MPDINNSELVPACMEQVGLNQYKCTKHGFVITTEVLPIRCFLCGGIPQNAQPVQQSTPKMPSLLQMAKNLTKTAVDFAQDGFKRVDEKVYKERIEVCNNNVCGKFLNGRCAHCGCYMHLKAWISVSKCPENLWKDENGVSNIDNINSQGE